MWNRTSTKGLRQRFEITYFIGSQTQAIFYGPPGIYYNWHAMTRNIPKLSPKLYRRVAETFSEKIVIKDCQNFISRKMQINIPGVYNICLRRHKVSNKPFSFLCGGFAVFTLVSVLWTLRVTASLSDTLPPTPCWHHGKTALKIRACSRTPHLNPGKKCQHLENTLENFPNTS